MATKPIMVAPWQMPDPTKPLKMQDKAAFQRTLVDHLANLEVESPTSPALLTSIICTIGPSCCKTDILTKMMDTGMTVMRLDMKNSDLEDQREQIDKVRAAMNCYSLNKGRVFPLALVMDLRGPEILSGAIFKEEKLFFKEGDVITLTTHPGWDTKGTKDKIFVDYKDLPYILKPKDRILLDYGRVDLRVRGIVDYDVVCEVTGEGGEMRSYRPVNLPGIPLDLPSVTEKDKRDIRLAMEYCFDALFVSAIRNKKGVSDIRDQLGERGKSIRVFSKIDSKLAYDYFEEIMEASDGIVINRGAMSIEMSTEKVLQAQRAIIAKCNKAGKPVFVMTEFLNSMIHKSCPTIAEVTDVAAVVMDGADGLVLQDETAIGDKAVLTVKTLAQLCREAEAEIWTHELFNSLNMAAVPPVDPAHAISIAAVEAALKAHASAILVVTTSGKSAQTIARYRPRCPIIAITRYGAVARQLNLWRGILPVQYVSPPQSCWSKDVDMRLQYGIEVGKLKDLVKPGDPLILVNGWRQGAGFTNNIRFVYASLCEPYVNPKDLYTVIRGVQIHPQVN